MLTITIVLEVFLLIFSIAAYFKSYIFIHRNIYTAAVLNKIQYGLVNSMNESLNKLKSLCISIELYLYNLSQHQAVIQMHFDMYFDNSPNNGYDIRKRSVQLQK